MFLVVPTAEALLGMSDHVTRWTGSGQTILVHLYTNNLTPSPANVLADYIELTSGAFPGYVAKMTTPNGTPFINAAGNAEQQMSDVLFQPASNPAAPVTIYGAFLTLHPTVGADTLLGGLRFDTPFIITTSTQAVPVDPDMSQAPLTSPITQ